MYQLFLGEVPFPHLDKGPGDVANHMLEEAAAANAVIEMRSFTPEHRGENAADFRTSEGIGFVGGGKGGEIVLAHEQRGGGRHAVFVERIRMMMNVASFEGRTDLAAKHAILVRLGESLAAGVKGGIGFGGRKHADLPRQQPVQRAAEIVHGNRIREVEGGDLRQGVNTRVGPAGAGDENQAPFDFRQNVLKYPLDGGETGLDLPTVKVRSIVGDRDTDAAHAGGRGRGGQPLAPPKKPTIPLNFQGTIASVALVIEREASRSAFWNKESNDEQPICSSSALRTSSDGAFGGGATYDVAESS